MKTKPAPESFCWFYATGAPLTTMCLNLICPTGVRNEGTELILDKNPGVKGSLKSINP